VTLYSTWPKGAAAKRAAQTVVKARLAACANLIDGVRSIYEWNGRIQRDREVVVLFKTTRKSLPALMRKLEELHPYDCPCLIAFPWEDAHTSYATWVRLQTDR
jgi:periplasmic divalent cation tolerance protein